LKLQAENGGKKVWPEKADFLEGTHELMKISGIDLPDREAP
jgi:hypothetical protein